MEPPLVPEGGKLQRGLMAVQPRAWLRLTYRAANQRYGIGRDIASRRPSGRRRAVLRETKWVDGDERHSVVHGPAVSRWKGHAIPTTAAQPHNERLLELTRANLSETKAM
jgi:hypothetical protein